MTLPLLLFVVTELSDIKPRMQSFVDKGDVAGTVTLVLKDGKRQHLEAVGWQDKEKQIPMSPGTIFEIMSMTKPITGTAIAILAEEGKLAFTDPVARHLREFADRKETIRDLLTHTSGMPEYGPAATKEIYLRYDWTLKDAVLLYSQQPPLFAPATKWQYSNTGMATLGRIVEVVSGQSYDEFVTQRILKPLGMNDTFFFPTQDRYWRIAMAYRVTKDEPKLQPAGSYILRKGGVYPMPEGGLYSTAEDYAKFLECVRLGGKSLLSQAMTDVMIEDHLGAVQCPWGRFGLGFMVDTAKQGFGHGGAFGTHGWSERNTGITRVFMVQKFGGSVEEIRNAFVNLVNASIQ